MDKNAIKKYAVWARRELIERVSQRAAMYGITDKDYGNPGADSVDGRLLSKTEKSQRQALIKNIKEKGYDQVMEQVAYTWFNRFAALRFMEVNGYLPSHIRVFTNDAGEFKPQILAEAIHLDLDGLDMNKVYELENANKSEELLKYLLIVQCNALNSILPGMFQKIDDYTELLLPDYLLREGSVIEQMVTMIPEEDWTDQVQIIGWLYQYYNTEPKDKVFADLKKNIKITKENIPAATQLFTPDWIVHYMVENSLGRLWLEGHPDSKSKMLPTKEEQAAYVAGQRDSEDKKWHYYLEEAEQERGVQEQLEEIRKEYAKLKPEEIKVIDPCMGSGHILCVLFDVLVDIYEDYGYTVREAATMIVENNLWGLDIDERAAQLSYFAVMMKARQYDRRFLLKKDEDGNPTTPQPHVYVIEESDGINQNCVDYYIDGRPELKSAMAMLKKEMSGAREYGSIINVTPVDFDAMYARIEEIKKIVTYDMYSYQALVVLPSLMHIAQAMAQKYDVVVTNPPYMGQGGMSSHLSEFVKKNYPDSKSDFFAAFIEKCGRFAKPHGYYSMITQHAWMFNSSYEKLRNKLLKKTIINMAHLGSRAFEEISGEVVQTTAFVINNYYIYHYQSIFKRLVEGMNEAEKCYLFLHDGNTFTTCVDNFSEIPGSPVAYWVGDNFAGIFSKTIKIADIAYPRQGLHTGDNNIYIHFWHEVNNLLINFQDSEFWSGDYHWAKLNKGGIFRKWYGNKEYVIKWKNEGLEIRNNGKSVGATNKTFLMDMIGFTDITSNKPSFRYYGKGFVYDVSGPSMFNKSTYVSNYFLLGLLNSVVTAVAMKILSPTMHMNQTALSRISFDVIDATEIEHLVKENIFAAKEDWDSFETSWDFENHTFIRPVSTVKEAYEQWKRECDNRFNKLKANEVKLNRIFIDIYGLQEELTPEVENKDITVHKADLQREVRSFLSYAVGCMLGRYSLDNPGLAYAGGEWDASKYTTFQPDKDDILPICDDEYFEDDIVGRFVKFVEVVYGKDTLEENLRFVSDALGGKGSSREVIRNYFLNDFFADHCKVYQKRPIYWLFDSGKRNGFKCLVYMHRYQPDTIARIRTDYVHEQQSRYRTAIAELEERIGGASTSERVKLSKQLTKLQGQAEELRVYEEKIHHLADQMIKIDLDDGVKVNYAKFQDVLAKIK